MRGHNVSKPFSQKSPYDLIVESEGELYRVQVKMFTNKKNERSLPISVKKQDRSGYTSREIDVVALYFASHNVWYLIPVEYIKPSIRINLDSEKCRWSKFKNNWEIFNDS